MGKMSRRCIGADCEIRNLRKIGHHRLLLGLQALGNSTADVFKDPRISLFRVAYASDNDAAGVHA